MSWFDSSFSFAKTALSQAQKSIDKVLDIKEESGAVADSVSNNKVVSTNGAASPPSSTSSESAAQKKTHGTQDPPAKSSSTWFSPSQSQSEPHSKQTTKVQESQSTPVAEKNSSSVLGSTWGAGDSFWGSYFSTPSGPPEEGGGNTGEERVSGKKKSSSEEVKDTPKSTSAGKSAVTRKLKSPASSASATKSENSEQKMAMDSPRLASTPKSSSTPLPQSREKKTTSESSTDLARSKSNHSTTPKTSAKPQQTGKPSKKSSKEGTAETSDVSKSLKAKKPTTKDHTGRSSATIPPSSTRESVAASVVEATDNGDGHPGTQVSVSGSVPPEAEHKSSLVVQHKQVESTGHLHVAAEVSVSHHDQQKREDSVTCISTSKDSSQQHTQPSSTSYYSNDIDQSKQAQVQVHVSSQANRTNSHLALRHSIPRDECSSETKQVPVELNLSSESKEFQKTVSGDGDSILEPVSNEQAGQTGISVQERTAVESEKDVTAKVTEKNDPSLREIQTSPPGTIELTHTAEREGEGTGPQVRSKGKKEEGERKQEVNDRLAKGDSHSEKEQQMRKDEAREIEQEQKLPADVERLKKELADVRLLLEAREQKMIEMSRETISLTETNQSLQEELAEAKRTGQTDVEDLRSEFTRRLATAEKKFQAVVKERDSLKKHLQALQDEQSQHKRSVGDELNRLIKEKDEQISQLMEEGEKLSKQELQSNSIIKKLRQKDKQNDQLLSAQRQQIEDLEGKVKISKEQLKKKEENETKYQESLGQLNTIAEQQAKELASLKSERDELLDKVRSLQTNLDNSYKELAELQKANAVTQTAAQEAALSAEQSAREELKSILDQQKIVAQREKESLLMQVDELRVSVSRGEQQAAWREDHLRQELADLQQRLQEAETRNQELTSSISQATKPLLRQIENLQAAHSAQSANWDKIEANLTQRLVQTQAQLSQSSEKERSAVEKELTLQSRVRTLETQLSGTKQEKSQLLATLELERAKLQTLEESQQRDSAKTEALRTSFQQSMDELRKEKEMLERQLEYERVRLEAESRKATLESQEKERLRAQLASSLSLNRTVSRQSSSGSQSEILEKSLHASEVSGSVSDMALHGGRGSVTVAPSASLIEHLQSLLKQKEGELSNSQNLVGSLERSRAAMAEDLANLSAQYETVKKEVETIPHLQQKLHEVERKHEAMLQMYGEKAEEAEELKLDIQDLKAMYRQQIEELLNKRR